VARLSVKQWTYADETHARAERLRLHAEELIEGDSLAYLAYVEAVRSGEDVANARARTIEIPLEIARVAAEVSALAEQSATRGNPKLLADAVVAAMFAAAAAEAAAYLVAVNVGQASDDPRLDEARKLASEASARLRSPGAPGSAGGPGRGRARSAGNRRR
jgi:formiminotetrahydrofolate cyclodeaminase